MSPEPNRNTQNGAVNKRQNAKKSSTAAAAVATIRKKPCGRQGCARFFVPNASGKGSDRLYCSPACRTQAWNARKYTEPLRDLRAMVERLLEYATEGDRLAAQELLKRLEAKP